MEIGDETRKAAVIPAGQMVSVTDYDAHDFKVLGIHCNEQDLGGTIFTQPFLSTERIEAGDAYVIEVSRADVVALINPEQAVKVPYTNSLGQKIMLIIQHTSDGGKVPDEASLALED